MFLDTFLDNYIAQKVKNVEQYMKNKDIIRKIMAENIQLNSMWERKKIQKLLWKIMKIAYFMII